MIVTRCGIVASTSPCFYLEQNKIENNTLLTMGNYHGNTVEERACRGGGLRCESLVEVLEPLRRMEYHAVAWR
jgi:hypothetical protein